MSAETTHKPIFCWIRSRHGRAGTPAIYHMGIPASQEPQVASKHDYREGLSLKEHADLYRAHQPLADSGKD